MDLYHKKVNIVNKGKRRTKDQTSENEYNPSTKKTNIYIQKMIPRNENIDFSTAGENIPNVRSSMEDIFSNEDNKKRAIKYVINIGRNKTLRNSPNYEMNRRYEKSASPKRGRMIPNPPRVFADSYETTPSRKLPSRRGESYFNNRLTTMNDYYPPISNTGYNNLRRKNKFNDNFSYKNNMRPNRRNYGPYIEIEDDDYYENPPNYITVEESQNDLEFSSINEDDRLPLRLRNADPRMLNRVNRVFNDTYERAARRVRNKDINAFPRVRKDSNRYINISPNYDDDMDKLIRTVEDLHL